MASRPNIRNGFGGNYRRIDQSNELKNNPGEPHLSQSPNTNLDETLTNHNPNGNNHLSYNQSSLSNTNLSHTYQMVTNQHLDFLTGFIRKPIASNQSNPPLISGRVRDLKEFHFNEKLIKLIDQLPLDRQNSVGFILLSMVDMNGERPSSQTNINLYLSAESTEKNSIYGLNWRLHKALQLVSPTNTGFTSNNNFESMDVIELQQNNTDIIKECNDQNKSNQTLCESPDIQKRSTKEDGSESGIDPGIFDDSSIVLSSLTENVSHNESKHSTGIIDYTKPNVISILRRIARCLAVRIAHKRHHLASAQQHAARNLIEEKLLRYRLSELCTDETAYQPHSPSMMADKLATDHGRGTIVNRFDRWHSNITAAIQLLCQLSRRLIFIDAQLVNVQRTYCELNKKNLPKLDDVYSHLKNTGECEIFNKLIEQQNLLLEQIKEAQCLRVQLETCRIRLLESIPPNLKCDTAYTILDSLGRDFTDKHEYSLLSAPQQSDCESPKSSSPSSFSTKHAMNEHSTICKNSTDNHQSNKNRNEYLRERVFKHLNDFLQWLVICQLYETEIKMDQDLWDNIQDELRLELSY